jgi:hypothetical protein
LGRVLFARPATLFSGLNGRLLEATHELHQEVSKYSNHPARYG